MVDAGESEVFERAGPQRLEHALVRGRRVDLAAGDSFEQQLKL